jgi:hypothetical protein
MTLEDSASAGRLNDVELSFDHQGCVRFSKPGTDNEVVITYEEFVSVAKILSVFESQM